MDDFKEIQSILTEKLTTWYEGLIGHLPNLVAAILVLIIFWIISLIVKRVSETAMRKTTKNETIVLLITSLIKIGIIMTGMFFALGILGLQKTITSLLAGAGIVGLAIGFAFQDMATNFLSGFYMGIRQPIKPGDLIKTQDFFGNVTHMGLRNTTVRDFHGQYIMIPNAQVFENPIINFSMTNHRRLDIPFGIAYEEDTRKAQEVVMAKLEELDFIHKDDDHPIEILAMSFGASSVDFEARFWIATEGQVGYPKAYSEGVIAVKQALDEAGIVIPYPVRTLAFNHETKATAPLKLLQYKKPEEQKEEKKETTSKTSKSTSAKGRTQDHESDGTDQSGDSDQAEIA